MDKDLKGELTCPVCMELFSRPLRLGCGHSYCRDCLLSIERRSFPSMWDLVGDAAAISCPECRHVFDLPASGVDSLPVDFKLSKLVEVFKKMEETDRRHDEQTTHNSNVNFSASDTLILVPNRTQDEDSGATSESDSLEGWQLSDYEDAILVSTTPAQNEAALPSVLTTPSPHGATWTTDFTTPTQNSLTWTLVPAITNQNAETDTAVSTAVSSHGATWADVSTTAFHNEVTMTAVTTTPSLDSPILLPDSTCNQAATLPTVLTTDFPNSELHQPSFKGPETSAGGSVPVVHEPDRSGFRRLARERFVSSLPPPSRFSNNDRWKMSPDFNLYRLIERRQGHSPEFHPDHSPGRDRAGEIRMTLNVNISTGNVGGNRRTSGGGRRISGGSRRSSTCVRRTSAGSRVTGAGVRTSAGGLLKPGHADRETFHGDRSVYGVDTLRACRATTTSPDRPSVSGDRTCRRNSMPDDPATTTACGDIANCRFDGTLSSRYKASFRSGADRAATRDDKAVARDESDRSLSELELRYAELSLSSVPTTSLISRREARAAAGTAASTDLTKNIRRE